MEEELLTLLLKVDVNVRQACQPTTEETSHDAEALRRTRRRAAERGTPSLVGYRL